jgi:acetolactate synthase-1/3 small subunit
MEKKHVISVWVENKFGVLSKVSGLFSSRGYNIQSLSVGETEDPEISRMTIVVKGDDRIMEQVKKQLHKLIDTFKVVDFVEQRFINKELCFLKVNTKGKERSELLAIASAYDAQVLDIGSRSMTLQIVDHEDRVEDFIQIITPFGILEVVRSGAVAIAQDEK